MEILSRPLENYLQSHTDAEDDLLKQIDRDTNLRVLKPHMLSGHYQGNLLTMLGKLVQAKCILEIGTYTGYATLCLAASLTENGKIHTIDNNSELSDMSKGYFEQSAHSAKINQHTGNALEIIPEIDELFDLVFIDADKKNNGTYFDLVIEKTRSGGLIVVDNVLWKGRVYDEEITDKDTENIRSFNKNIADDNRVEKLILPVRDGLFLILKK